MSRRTAIDALAALERREAAFVRAAAAERRRLDSASSAQRVFVAEARSLLAREPLWHSSLCGIVDRRADRARTLCSRIARRALDVERAAEGHEMQRRRWARAVRGLIRRASRDAAWETPWHD